MSRSPKQVTYDFTDRVGAEGFRDIVIHHGSRRLLWVFLVIIAWIFAIHNCSTYITTFMSYPVATEVVLTASQKTSFPAVTICNLNPIRKSELFKLDLWNENTDSVDSSVQLIKSFDPDGQNDYKSQFFGPPDSSGHSTDDKKSKFKSEFGVEDDADAEHIALLSPERMAQFAFASAMSRMTFEDIKKHGHKVEETIVDCTIAMKRCESEDRLVFRHPLYGQCFTLNSGQISLDVQNSTMAGPDQGLEITLFAQAYEYIPFLTSSVGFRVHIHDQAAFPHPEDYGYLVAPGTLTQIEVRKLEMTRLDYPYRKNGCAGSLPPDMEMMLRDWPQAEYSQLVCSKKCMQKVLQTKCQCFSPTVFFPRKEPPDPAERPCSLGDLRCMMEELVFENDAFCQQCLREACKCSGTNRTLPTLLHSIAYLTSVISVKSTFKLVSAAQCGQARLTLYIKAIMNESFTSNVPKLKDDVDLDDKNEIAKNLLRVKIYYERLSYQSIIESIGYSLSSMLGDIGGAVGLWAGLSILSMVQCVEFFFELCCSCKNRGRRGSVDAEPQKEI